MRWILMAVAMSVGALTIVGSAGAKPVPPPPGVTTDFNGDGITDAVLNVDEVGLVVLGARGHPSSLKTVRITGAKGTYPNVAAAGDVNGDGIGDVVVSGSTAVVFGSRKPKNVDTRSLGSRGFSVTGLGSDATLLPAGDVNGDGLADLLAIGHDRYAVILGARSGANVDASIDGPRVLGFTIPGNAGIAPAGDLNNDGRADFLTAGAEYLGAASGPPVRREFTPSSNSPRLESLPAGDIDGDGNPDYFQEAGCHQDDYTCAGHFFLLFGAKGNMTSPLQVDWPAAQTLRVDPSGGGTESDPSYNLAAVGDVTHDGHADIYSAPIYGTGVVVSLSKRKTGSAKVKALTRFTIKRAHAPVLQHGATFLQEAPSASGPGDVNGDGIGDLALVLAGNESLNASKGEALAWIVYGRRSGTVTLDRLKRSDGVVVLRK